MKDCRIPLSIAVPAAIGVLGVLWLLRRKSGPDKEKATSKPVPKEDKHLPRWNDKEQLEQRTLHVQKESATISQRKIPENQARDRGSSDLDMELIDNVKNQVSTTSSDQLKPETNLDVAQSLCKAQTSTTQCDQDGKVTPSQKAHKESLEITAMGAEFQEIHMDQPVEILLTQPINHKLCDLGTFEHLAIEGQLFDSQAIQDALFCKTDSPQLQPNVVRDHLQTLTDLNLKQTSSDTQTHAENVQLNPQAENFTSVRHNTHSVTPMPSDCDKTVECFDNSNSNKRDTDAVLIADGQEIVTSLQQTISVSSLQKTSELPPPQYSSLSIAQTHSQVCPSQSVELVGHIEDSLSTNESELDSEVRDKKTVSTTVKIAGGTSCGTNSLPHDLNEARSPASLWMPTTSSSSNDILCPEGVDSIWDTDPCIETSLKTSASLVNTFSSSDTDNSLNLISSSCDLNNTQGTSPETTLFNENLSDEAYISCCDNGHGVEGSADALSSKSTKDESPVMSSSPACDSNSEGSNDSGRGGSEHDVAYQAGETLVHFEFNMPSDLCGRFIGKQGKNINYLKNRTGAHVSLTNNMYTPDYQICQVVGNQTEVDDALSMIRRKFPLRDYPLLTMAPIDMSPAPVVLQPDHQLIIPDVMQLSLPEGVSVDVFVSAIVDAGHLFVQQPTHRSFMSLEKLNYFMGLVYAQDPNVPCVPTPIESGIICVCENDGFWYRAMIMTSEDENGECQVKFVDYGGYASLAVSSLKQIRADFMTLPFQAVECFMANVTPNQSEQFFSEEATVALSDMTRDKLLQCQVVARVENGIPYIHLYQISTESNSAVMINRALVNSRLVRWIEIL